LRMSRNRPRSSLGYRYARPVRLIYACGPRRRCNEMKATIDLSAGSSERPAHDLAPAGRNSTSRRRKIEFCNGRQAAARRPVPRTEPCRAMRAAPAAIRTYPFNWLLLRLASRRLAP
jgi:hypothetical protein